MRKIALLLAFFFLAVGLGNAAPVILSDNLITDPQTPTANRTVSFDTWLAASFRTDDDNYFLTSVTLPLYMASDTGMLEVCIYSNSYSKPSGIPLPNVRRGCLEALTGPGTLPTSLQNVTFTSSGLHLVPNSIYWVVLRGIGFDADVQWAWTQSTDGTGEGFMPGWEESHDGGFTWSAISTEEPQLIQVVADTKRPKDHP